MVYVNRKEPMEAVHFFVVIVTILIAFNVLYEQQSTLVSLVGAWVSESGRTKAVVKHQESAMYKKI